MQREKVLDLAINATEILKITTKNWGTEHSQVSTKPRFILNVVPNRKFNCGMAPDRGNPTG
ncbi:MAG: hypothetical protein Q7S34_04475 [bacterium]|nr:hypothetical protein [bacterium]